MIVDDRTVPLPQNWNDFPTIPSNKQELALLLSKELIAQAPVDNGFHTAGDTQYTEDTQCVEHISSVVEWQTHNRGSLGSNPPLHVQAAEVQVLSNTWNQTETFIP